MPDIAQLAVRITGDEKGATQALDSVDKKVKEAGGSSGWKSMLTDALSFAGGLGIVKVAGDAFGFLKDHIGEVVQSGMDANRMDALLAAGLRSTHDASGQTVESLQNLSDTLREHTGITDDAAKGAEQMLLTYTGIGKDVFPAATQAVADMATRFNNGAIPSAQQMSQVALQLGKALNDPATGMTALRRVGVTFTAQQQEQIKAMEKAGNTAGAQSVILKELQKEFGGSAAAAGQANGGMAIFSATMDDLKEKVGQALLPVLTGLLQNVVGPLATAFATVLPKAIGAVQGAIQTVAPIFETLFNGGKDLAQLFLNGIKPGLDAVGNAFGKLHGPGLDVGGIVKDIAGGVRDAAPFVKQLAGQFSAFLANVVVPLLPKLQDLASWLLNLIKQDVLANLKILGQIFGTVKDAVMNLLPHLQPLVAAFQQNILPAIQFLVPLVLNLAQIIGQILVKAFQIVMPVVSFLAGILANVLAGAITVVGAIIRAAVPIIQQLASWLGEHLQPIIHNVSETLSELHAWFQDKVLPIIQKVWAFIQANVLPILEKLGQWLLNQVVANLQIAWGFISANVLPILGKLAGFIANDIGAAFQSWGNGIKAVAGFIGNLFDGIGKLLDQLGNLKDKIGDVLSHIPSIPGLPHFAMGGTMGASGLAVVGEQGPELVALPAGARIYSAAQTQQIAARGQASGVSGGTAQTVLIIQLDSRTLAQGIVPHIPGVVRIGTGIRHI